MSDQNHAENAKPTQQYLNIADIRDDVLILRNGELRQIMEITALNFALKSEQEQSAIIYQYQNFLNSLQFPIQILIQSRKLELTNYLLSLQARMSQSSSPLIRNQIADYIDFINRLINLGQIMEKQFYVVVPLATAGIRARSLFGQLLKKETVSIEEKDLAAAKSKLLDRTESIRSGLASMGLQVTILDNDQIKQLLYTTYNPAISGGLSTANNPTIPQARTQ